MIHQLNFHEYKTDPHSWYDPVVRACFQLVIRLRTQRDLFQKALGNLNQLCLSDLFSGLYIVINMILAIWDIINELNGSVVSRDYLLPCTVHPHLIFSFLPWDLRGSH